MSTNQREIEMKVTTGLLAKNENHQEQYEASNYDLTRAAHPGVCFFHIFFKFCAFFSQMIVQLLNRYLFLGLIISSQLFQYILIMIFHSLDFYTVKNITGKFLVGLRWYSTFGPKGEEIWKFESFDLSKRSKIDSSIFWSFQFGASCTWAFFVFANVWSLGIVDILFAGVGMCLSWINLWGYYKSSKDQQRKMKNVQSYLTKKGIQMAMKS